MAEPYGKCINCGTLLSSESKGRWGTAWCAKCDKIRIEQISGQLKEIAACFPNKNEAQAVTDQKATCPKCNEPWDGCYCSSCFYRLTPAGQIRELHNQLAAKDKQITELTAELRNATASIWDRMAELGKAHDTIKSLTRERDEAQAEAKSEAEAKPEAEAKFREAQKEIDRLTKLIMDLTTEKTKSVPTRRPWPKGPFMVEQNDKGWWCLRDTYGNIVVKETTKEATDTLALALTKFPAAVALLLSYGMDVRNPLLARVDAAGFDMLVFTAEEEQDDE